MKTHLHIDACALVGRFRISIHTNPKGWHEKGYRKNTTAPNPWTETLNLIRQIAIGWIAVAYITTTPNPEYDPEAG